MNLLTKIKLQIKKIGVSLKMVDYLTNITDHPDINMDPTELERVLRNKEFYKGNFDEVEYINSNGERCHRPFHPLNVPKILSRKLSKLVFNEGVTISLNDDSAQEFIDDVFKLNRFEKNFGEELEGGYAVSGLVIRPVFDPIRKTIKLTYCSADNFFPLSGNANDVDEGAIRTTFIQIEKKKPIYYSLIEIHKKTPTGYEITNQLFRSEVQSSVGYSVPLDSIPQTQGLEPHVSLEGFSRPLFVYIKMAGKNNLSYGSPLGLGVIDNAYKQFMDLNDKYDQFMWEIEEAGRKILASDHFFKVKYDANGSPIRHFDNKTSVFQRLRSDDEFIDEFAPSLRSAEFIASINFILRIIEMQNGFSAGTFSFDGQSVKTATEIVSENTETFQTRSDNVLIVSECLEDLIISILELGSSMGIYSGPVNPDITVDFDDGVFTDKNTRMDYNGKAMTFGIMSKMKAMMSQFGYSEDEALKELAQIESEQSFEPTESDVFGQEESDEVPEDDQEPETDQENPTE